MPMTEDEAALQAKGWTLAAIADELETTVNAVEKWKAGQRIPANRKSMLEHLGRLHSSTTCLRSAAIRRAHGTGNPQPKLVWAVAVIGARLLSTLRNCQLAFPTGNHDGKGRAAYLATQAQHPAGFPTGTIECMKYICLSIDRARNMNRVGRP